MTGRACAPCQAPVRTSDDVVEETLRLFAKHHARAPTDAELVDALAARVVATEQAALANACFGFARARPVVPPRPPKPGPEKEID